MKSSLSTRITFGYLLILGTALLASTYGIVTLQRNKKLDDEIKTFYLPLYLDLKDLEAIAQEIDDYLITPSANNENDRLVRSVLQRYARTRESIASRLTHFIDSTTAPIPTLLSDFDRIVYRDSHVRPEHPLFIRTGKASNIQHSLYSVTLKKAFDKDLSAILAIWRVKINSLQEEKESSDMFLSYMLAGMIAAFVIAVIVVYIHTRRTIVQPIIGVKDLILTLARGRTVYVDENGRSDEIGKIMTAVGDLTRNIRVKSKFALQVGQGNYSAHLPLLSGEDEMGKALLNMRDNLKRSVHEEQRRAWENRQLAMVVNKTTNMVMLAHRTGEISWVNPAFSRITGYRSDEVIGKSLRVLIAASKVDRHLIAMGRKTMHEGQGFKDVEIISQTKDGKNYWVSLEVQPIIKSSGEVDQYIIIGTDITERKAVQQSLEERNTELEKTNSELDRFVYSASHDLRAPVASLLGLIEVARMESEPETIKSLLHMQKNSLLRLDRFIQDIVNYSRNSRLDVETESIDFDGLIRKAFEQLQYMEDLNSIRKVISVEQSGSFYSSNMRIGIVINNLIANGIKYADLKKSDPYLDIRIKADHTSAEIIVADNGEGIPEHAREKIFNMFYRASVKSSGSGLGLYIAKEALQKIGGEIQVRSEQGHGTEFKIVIPGLG